MTRQELIELLSEAMARVEGWYLTEAQCKARGWAFPTRPQVNCNPGNLRRWAFADGKPYPRKSGYVDLLAWAGGDRKKAIAEGWRIFRKQISNYLDGKLHGGKSPTLYQMLEKYAPAGDGNHPKLYAEGVAREVGIPPDKPLKDCCYEPRH